MPDHRLHHLVEREAPPKKARLTLVGTGIKPGLQTTAEALHHIRKADRVFYSVNGPVAEQWIRGLNPRAHALDAEPDAAAPVLGALDQGQEVCVALYGHPAIFVAPVHEMLWRAREVGVPVSLTPGVSFEDCLYVDLGFDPGLRGARSFDATDFLLHDRSRDPQSALILWQVGAIGFRSPAPGQTTREGMDLLSEVLGEAYTADHEVVLYEAAMLPMAEPRIERIPVRDLATARTTLYTTLYVPPLPPGPIDREMARSLGIDREP